MTMELQLVEALCGFQKPVQTLDNRTLLVTSHPGISQHILELTVSVIMLAFEIGFVERESSKVMYKYIKIQIIIT